MFFPFGGLHDVDGGLLVGQEAVLNAAAEMIQTTR
jgi:hypothetical protein